MILISKAAEPHFFRTESLRRRVEALHEETENLHYWRQKAIRFRFPDVDLAGLKHALLYESNGKCAYCEQKLHGPGFMEIDHFRPISGAVDDEGKRSDQHYYWLTYEWSNMLASCSECNRAKGSKFPVASDRIPVGVMSPDLDAYEHPMILNPTRYVTGKHLSFSPDGRINEISLEGAYTISILKLNREHLVARRLAHLEKLKAAIDRGDGRPFLSNDAEFAGMCRELFQKLGGSLGEPLQDEVSPALGTALTPEPTPLGTEDEAEKEKNKYYSDFPLLKEIHVDGLWGLNSLTLKIPANGAGIPGWLAILGENGVGKSSILRALALALYDGNAVQDLCLNPSDLLNAGTKEGLISIHFDTGQRRTVRLNSMGLVSDAETDAVAVLLLGYGATRLPANNSHPFQSESKMARIANLFDPYTPLREPSEWLASLEDKQFDYAAGAIKKLLNLPEDCYLSRSQEDPNIISLNWFGTTQKLRWLSQGYQNVISVACDIMAMVFGKWASTDDAQGTVLLDELENHLHPAWKMRMVSNLRAAFPRMQFVVTTHDPLCLRGLSAGEVALLRRRSVPPYETEVLQDLPSVADMRVDQILTSSYFGLRTTVDPEVEALFDEYYSLLDREHELRTDEQERLNELKVTVSKYDLPTLLDRDRIMYRAIDRYLAQRKKPLPHNDADFDTDLLNEIDRIADALASDAARSP